jgi:Integrase core domain
LRRYYVLFFIAHASRRVWLAGCSTNPTGAWVTQQARNVGLDLADEGMRFVIRDRDGRYSGAFDEVFCSSAIRVVKTPVRAPKANAIAERFVRTVRAECLDWLLIVNRRHLERVLRVYVEHYNTQRPHRALNLQPPQPQRPPPTPTVGDVRRHDRLGGPPRVLPSSSLRGETNNGALQAHSGFAEPGPGMESLATRCARSVAGVLSHHGGEPVRIARALAAGGAAVLICATAAQAATPELSTTNRLQDRREVAAGQRSYAVGFEDGRFYANGWHTTGEMGGVWSPPLKLLDGVWFGIGDEWVGPATKFSSGWGYTRFDLPDAGGLRLQRTDFAPDGSRAVLFGLQMTNPAAADKTVTVKVDAHSELIGAYPWGFGGVTPNASDNIADQGSFTDGALQFTDDGALPGAPEHHYAAMVAANQAPASGQADPTGGAFRGPQGSNVCSDQEMPSACDDGPFGKGTGGELRYDVTVPAGGSKTLWVAAAGSDKGLGEARSELNAALQDPAGALAEKVAARQKLSEWSQLSLGDHLLQDAVDWGKQNLADLTQTASDLQIRWTNQGKQYPAPLGTVPHVRFFGAGFPDYPWLFATDGEYTNFAAVALGQFDVAKDHLRALRDVSDVLNDRSGIVVHEAVTDGSIWYGHDSQTTAPDGTKTNDFNTDETVKFPSAVALIWRWTGDNRFRDEMYDFAKRNLRVVDRKLDVDRDGWPEGSGNVERPGMGPEKLDNGVYYLRSLYDLADMARSKHDGSTVGWATSLANKLRAQFEGTWWDTAAQQYADSLIDPGNVQSFQKHWIGQVPMEAELNRVDQATPGVASQDHGTTALAGRENSCFSGDRPGSRGLFHTGCGGGPEGNGEFSIFSLTTSIQAVGEGNYGRLGPEQQQRYTDANAETMFSEPATGGTPDEQPGAMPEIFPSGYKGDLSTGFTPNITRCWTCRSMVMQAWGNYGTVWSVIHQQLGVRPFLNQGLLQVVPQVPPDQPSVEGTHIRLGTGSVAVFAAHDGSTYTTKVDATDTPVRELLIGHTLPREAQPALVLLDGHPVNHYDARLTNRGLEVSLQTQPGGKHTLTIATT